MTVFAAHGTLLLTIDDSIILIEAEGPWNIEYLDSLHQHLLWAVTQIYPINYGVLLVPKGEAISVEAGLEYHINFIRHSKATAVAINLAHCTTAQLTENIFSKIYRAAGLNYAFFDNGFDARHWLEKQLETNAANTS